MTSDIIARLEKATKADRWLDEQIAEALGGSVRKVTGLGMNGRTPGRYRVFWPHSNPFKAGSAVPYYTKTPESRAKAIARLRALAQGGE